MSAGRRPVLRPGGRCDERGAVALISSLVSVVLLVVAAFVVDIGGTWARRGQLQVQADQAALYAAASLPAYDAASRLTVAREAAWYIACHPVLGQRDLSTIPDCPATSSTRSPALDAYAHGLLHSGMVTFPDTNQVSVTTPPAQVDFSFGQVAGAEGTVQQKTASARVLSPGNVEPFGLSLNCLLTVANSLPGRLGGTTSQVLPLNYLAPGPLTKHNRQTKWKSNLATSSTVKVRSITPTQVDPVTPAATFTVTGDGWTAASRVKVAFALGDTNDLDLTKGKTVETPEILLTNLTSLGTTATATATLPLPVATTPGNWHVKVAVHSGSGWVYSQQDLVLTVTLREDVTDSLLTSLGCTRVLKSRDSSRTAPRATSG